MLPTTWYNRTALIGEFCFLCTLYIFWLQFVPSLLTHISPNIAQPCNTCVLITDYSGHLYILNIWTFTYLAFSSRVSSPAFFIVVLLNNVVVVVIIFCMRNVFLMCAERCLQASRNIHVIPKALHFYSIWIFLPSNSWWLKPALDDFLITIKCYDSIAMTNWVCQ